MTAQAATTDSDRLAKLWEAYRVQEEEYHEALQRVERLTKELEGRGQDVLEREKATQAKDAQLAELRSVIEDKDRRIAQLESLEEDVKAVQAYKDRISDLEGALAQEKERLAKLFLLYEEATKK